MRPRSFLLFSLAIPPLLVASRAARADTLQVGPGQAYAKPCDAIAVAKAGDTIEVDAAGSYDGDTCAWSTDALTVKGVNGLARIDLTGVTPAQEKGIFTISAPNATIESFELSGAAISASAGNNGAGIRHQGTNLTVRGCYLHDNQDGILGAPATANTGTVLLEDDEFADNGAGDGYSHNLYIGDYASLTMQFSYSHGAKVGHLFKSRAYVTSVLYNRLTDETGTTASYEVDLPNGGTAYVIGNLIEQSMASQNPTIVTFGEEGFPTGYDTHLFVVNNTILNDLQSGTFVNDAASTPAVLTNNIFYEAGTVTNQAGAVLTTNFVSATQGDPMFVDVASYDVELSKGSPCIDEGTAPGKSGSMSLAPAYEYVQPEGDVARTVVGAGIDIGAYEYGLATDGGSGSGGSSGGGSGRAGSSSGAGGSGGSSGSGSGSSSGGAADAGLDGGRGGGGSGGGCGCVAAGSAGDLGLGGAWLGVVGAALVRRRRSAR